MNAITVSFDQNIAVRGDGTRLKAVPRPPDGGGCCLRCAAYCNPGTSSCSYPEAAERLCQSTTRRDGRYIRWEAAT